MKWNNKNYKKSLRSVAYLQFQTAQSPPTDSICAMVVVWRGNIDRTAVSCVVYDSCAQQYAHKCDQLLNLYLVRFSLVCVCVLCKGFVCIFVCSYVSLDHFFVLLVNFVRFGFFQYRAKRCGNISKMTYFVSSFKLRPAYTWRAPLSRLV